MKVNRILPLLLCAVILVITVVLSSLSKPKETAPASAEITEITAATADEPKQEENEMRGVWVTYMDLSTENESSQSEAAFREMAFGYCHDISKLTDAECDGTKTWRVYESENHHVQRASALWQLMHVLLKTDPAYGARAGRGRWPGTTAGWRS